MAKAKSGLDATLDELNKLFGAGSVMRMGETTDTDVECITTGILPLDLALGPRRGIPRGRFTEIFGPMSSGKSTVASHIVAAAQARGEICAYIDAEHAIDPVYAEAIGVNIDDLIINQPFNGEEGLQVTESLAQSGEVSVIVIDSVATLTPRAIIEGDYGSAFVGIHPKLISQSMSKLVGPVDRNNVAVILINQLRDSIGNAGYGPSEYRPGGRAIPFYASVSLDIRRIKTEKKGEEAIGNRTRVKVVKNKVGKPWTQCEFDLEYGIGVPKEGCLIDLALDYGLLKQSGAWFASAVTGENLAQGREKLKAKLREDKDLFNDIDKQVRSLIDA
jgi:recombination protein RecA